MSGLTLTGCPECGCAAEVLREDVLPSTDGPVPHLFLACVNRHWFLLPTEMILQPRGEAVPAVGRVSRQGTG